MQDELKLAARVHYSFLPEHYEDDRLDVATRLTPKAVLGGDYCSVIPLGGQRFAACICDAVGHGVEHPLPVRCSLQACSIDSGDRILLYTDGLTEARNRNGEEFGYAGMARYADAHAREDNRDFVNGLCAAVHDYSKGEIQDDILCLGIRVK